MVVAVVAVGGVGMVLEVLVAKGEGESVSGPAAADPASGCRSRRTSATKPSASKVKGAPRRACACSGSGIADSCARVRWKPSMGTTTATGLSSLSSLSSLPPSALPLPLPLLLALLLPPWPPLESVWPARAAAVSARCSALRRAHTVFASVVLPKPEQKERRGGKEIRRVRYSRSG